MVLPFYYQNFEYLLYISFCEAVLVVVISFFKKGESVFGGLLFLFLLIYVMNKNWIQVVLLKKSSI